MLSKVRGISSDSCSGTANRHVDVVHGTGEKIHPSSESLGKQALRVGNASMASFEYPPTRSSPDSHPGFSPACSQLTLASFEKCPPS